MRRRDFLWQVANSVILAPFVARAEPASGNIRTGMLETISAAANAANHDALRSGLKEMGYGRSASPAIDLRIQGIC